MILNILNKRKFSTSITQKIISNINTSITSSNVSNSSSIYLSKKTSQPILSDTFGRFHSYLRMSLTEKCNLRCTYCMPPEGIELTPTNNLLTTQERKLILSIFSLLGIKKVRFTGGEPTVNKDLLSLIQHVKSLNNINLIGMTSNGVVLAKKFNEIENIHSSFNFFNSTSDSSKSSSICSTKRNSFINQEDLLNRLVDAGLTSINISLDTMDPEKFASITRRDKKNIYRVLSSILAAKAYNLKQLDEISNLDNSTNNKNLLSVKVNCVLVRGMNDDEIINFINFSKEFDITIRFIEMMPFGGNDWDNKKFISYMEVIDQLKTNHNIILEKEPKELDKSDTTKWYRIKGSDTGRIGFITSMSNNFCSGCNRIRITADGRLKVCLFGDESLSLRDIIRSPEIQNLLENNKETEAIEIIAEEIHQALQKKHFKHGGHKNPEGIATSTNRPMILIGG